MGETSSAIPKRLIRFGDQATDIDDRLLRQAGTLGDALDAFRASHSELAPPIPQLDDSLRQLARSGRAMDEWVGRIGRAFAEADGGRTDRAVSVADLLLLPTPPAPLPPEFIEEILDDIKDIADWIKSVASPAGPLSEVFENFPRHITLLIEEVTELARHTRILITEVVDGVVRHIDITIDELLRITRWEGRTIDVAWLRRAAPWLKRLGQAGDILTVPLAAWDQWEEDAKRTDLSSTERVLRAGLDGLVRGGVQVVIGIGTGAAAAALVPFGPPGWIAAGAVIVVGIVVGEVADQIVEEVLDRFYDWAVDDIADFIDDSGRWIGDRAGDIWQWGGDRVEDLQDTAGNVRSWAGDRIEDVGDAIDSVTPW